MSTFHFSNNNYLQILTSILSSLDMIRSLIHGDSGLGKTKLAETLRSHVVEDDGCE